MSDWQQISSAPPVKDVLIATNAHARGVVIARWDVVGTREDGVAEWAWQDDDGDTHFPIYWQPLPLPPEED